VTHAEKCGVGHVHQSNVRCTSAQALVVVCIFQLTTQHLSSHTMFQAKQTLLCILAISCLFATTYANISVSPTTNGWVLSDVGKSCAQACNALDGGACNAAATLSITQADITAILEFTFEEVAPCTGNYTTTSEATQDAHYRDDLSTCTVVSSVGKQVCCCDPNGCDVPSA
jgi:hypothetical protein